MKKIEYACNLCGDIRERKSALASMYEMYWNGTSWQFQTIKDNCDKHICTYCVERIKATDFTPLNP